MDLKKRAYSISKDQNAAFQPDLRSQQLDSLQNPLNHTYKSESSQYPADSLDFAIEKLKGYFKLMLNLEYWQDPDKKEISEQEIMEILGIEQSDLTTLKNIIEHTDKFLKILRNPDFISLMRSEKE